MTLTIITINRNNADGLKKTLESVAAQNCKDYEHIIVDGASTDDSVQIIKDYVASDAGKNVSYWVSESDKGIYNAMNKGIKQAKGEYCLFLNSGDCLYKSNVLQQVLYKIHNKTADVFFGDYLFGHDKKTKKRILYEEVNFLELCDSSIAHPTSFIRTHLLIENNYDEKYKIVSDWKFFFTIYLKSAIFIHIPIFVSIVDDTGISTICDNKSFIEREKIKNELLPKVLATTFNKENSKLIHEWVYYANHFKQNKVLYNITLFSIRCWFTFFRLLHIIKR